MRSAALRAGLRQSGRKLFLCLPGIYALTRVTRLRRHAGLFSSVPLARDRGASQSAGYSQADSVICRAYGAHFMRISYRALTRWATSRPAYGAVRQSAGQQAWPSPQGEGDCGPRFILISCTKAERRYSQADSVICRPYGAHHIRDSSSVIVVRTPRSSMAEEVFSGFLHSRAVLFGKRRTAHSVGMTGERTWFARAGIETVTSWLASPEQSATPLTANGRDSTGRW